MNALSRFADNVFEFDRADSPGGVLFFKLFELFLAAFALKIAWRWAFEIGALREVVLPLGIARYVDVQGFYGTPFPFWLAGALTVLVVLGFFRLFRYSYLGAVALLHLLYAVRYTQGEIPHSANLFVMSLLGLGLATAFFDDAHERRRFTLGFTYFFIGLAYTLAAASKLIATGLSWPDGIHLWMWIEEKSVDQMLRYGAVHLTWVQTLALGSRPIATLLLAFGLVTEAFAWLVWFRRLRLPILLAIIGMHFGIYLSMQIVFELSFYQLGLLLLPLPALFDALAQRHRAAVWKAARLCAPYC